MRFPSIDRLLTCCKGQSELYNFLVIHIKISFYSIDNIKPAEKKFSDILLEKSSLKTIELSEKIINDKNFAHMKSFFWDDSSNHNHHYKKNDSFEIYPQQVLNNMINLIEHFYKIIYNKNNLITFIDNPEINIENIIENCFSYDVLLDITEILATNNSRTVTFEFISNKINEILQEYFKPLCNNYYSNERPLYDNNSATDDDNISFKKELNTFEMKDFINNKNLRAKDLFIIELNLLELCEKVETFNKILIYDKDKYKDVLKDLKTKLISSKYKDISINIKISLYFLPEIEDIFSEQTKEEIPIDNDVIFTVENDNKSQYYFNDNYLSKKIPSYIKYHNQDYFITISKKQKSYLHSVINSFTSLQSLIQLETIRFMHNNTHANKKIDYSQIYELLNKVNIKYFRNFKMNFKVCNRNEILNYIGLDGEVYSVSSLLNTDKYSYIMCFEKLSDKIYKDFTNHCLINMDNKIFNENSYNIPIWIMFTISNYRETDLKKRKFSVDDFRENEVLIEIKYIDETFFNEYSQQGILQKKIEDIMDFYIKSIDKKALINMTMLETDN